MARPAQAGRLEQVLFELLMIATKAETSLKGLFCAVTAVMAAAARRNREANMAVVVGREREGGQKTEKCKDVVGSDGRFGRGQWASKCQVRTKASHPS